MNYNKDLNLFEDEKSSESKKDEVTNNDTNSTDDSRDNTSESFQENLKLQKEETAQFQTFEKSINQNEPHADLDEVLIDINNDDEKDYSEIMNLNPELIDKTRTSDLDEMSDLENVLGHFKLSEHSEEKFQSYLHEDEPTTRSEEIEDEEQFKILEKENNELIADEYMLEKQISLSQDDDESWLKDEIDTDTNKKTITNTKEIKHLKINYFEIKKDIEHSNNSRTKEQEKPFVFKKLK